MKQLSTTFIQALADERVYLAFATVHLMDDTVLQLTNEEIWSGGFSYEEAVSSDDSFTAIGSAIMGSATLIINNIYDDYTDYDFTNARVSLSVGMMNTDQVLAIGEYRVDDTSYNGATIQLTLLDNMAEFDRPYSISTLTYPTTLSRIVYDACLNCGISAAHSAINFPNGGYTISTRPTDENVTFRDIISWSAALAGCFAKMNPAGELEFKWFDVNSLNAIDTTLPTFHPWETGDLYSSSGVHYLYSLTSQNICTDDVIITGITVRVKTEDNAETQSDVISFSYNSSGYVAGELENDGSEYIIIIENNSFITTANARTIVTYLGTQLVGLRFRKLNIYQVSDPSIEAGDVAIVTDRKLNSYKIFVTRNVFHIGSSQNIVCGADTPSRSNSSTNSEITKSYIEARKLFKKSMSATDDALNSAILAAQAAREAQESADSALTSARSANNSATSALTQLSVVEDVAGTLNWIRENADFVLTTDIKVNPTKVYFVYERGEFTPVISPDLNVNPAEEGWYELDVAASQSEYILAHLAVTDAGLWVLPFNTLAPHILKDSSDYDLVDSENNLLMDFSKDPQNSDGYKVLLASDGMTIYNSVGTAVANYGVTTTIGSALLRNVHIDSDAVYIRDGNTVLAKYGTTTVIGDASGYNTYIDTNGFYVRNGLINLAKYGSTTIFYALDGQTIAAEVGSNGLIVKKGSIQLGQKTSATDVTNNGTYIDTSGNMATSNIKAHGGTIGGFNISASGLRGTSDTNKVIVMKPGGWAFAAGGTTHESYADCPFRVSIDGALYSTSGNIGGWTINGTDGLYIDNTSSGALLTPDRLRVFKNSSTISNRVVMDATTTTAMMQFREFPVGGGTGKTLDVGKYDSNSWGITSNQAMNVTTEKSLNIYGVTGLSIGTSATSVIWGIDGAWIRPETNSGASLGHSNYRWAEVYCTRGAFNGSDLKEKSVIDDFDWKVDEFISGLKPIAFQRINNDKSISKRISLGFGAQDVARLSKDIGIGDLRMYEASIVETDENGETISHDYHGEEIDDSKLIWSLNYTEFIAPMILEIQRLMNRVKELEDRLNG